MSWSKPSFGIAVAAVVVAGGLASLPGCTLAPVYGDHAAATRMHLSYADPRTRLEQLVYRDLSFRLGQSSAPDADRVTVSISKETGSEFLSQTPDPRTINLARLTGTLTLTGPAPENKVVYRATRTASATYTTTDQALSDQAALENAYEQAAHQLAESFRLALLAASPLSP
jgi:LPS-assembly lipoprotein